MRITQLQLYNWKGLSETIKLDHLNLLTGPNGSGKTACIMAPSYVITGQTPLGIRPSAIAPLCGPCGGGVTMQIDDGFVVTRNIDTVEAATTELRASGVRHGSVNRVQAEVSRRLGEFAPMFNLGEFVNLSPEKRRESVLELCSSQAGVSLGHDELLAAITHVMEHAGQSDRQSLEAQLRTCDAAAGVQVARQWVKSIRATARSRRNEAIQTARRLSGQVGLGTPGNPAETTERLASLRADLLDIESLLAGQKAAGAAITALEREVDDKRAELARLEEQLKGFGAPPDLALVDTLDQRIKELQSQSQTTSINAAVADYTATSEAHTELLDERRSAGVEQKGTDEDIARMKRDLQALEEAPMSQVAQAAKECGRLLMNCKVTDEAQSAWSKLVSLIHEASLELLIHAKKEGLLALSARRAAVAATVSRLDAAIPLSDEAVSNGQAKIAKLREAQGAREEEIARMEAERVCTRNQIKAYSAGIHRCKKSIQSSNSELVEAQGRLDALRSAVGDVSAEALTTQAEALRAKIEDVELQYQEQNKNAVLQKELDTATLSAERHATADEVCKDAMERLAILRERWMGAMVAPLVKGMDTFLSAAMPGTATRCRLENENGKPAFDLRWVMPGGAERSLPALSGGETGLFGAALAYALTILADPPLKLLLIEASELDAGMMECLCRGIDVVADRIDTVMVATHLEPPSTLRSHWNVIRRNRKPIDG